MRIDNYEAAQKAYPVRSTQRLLTKMILADTFIFKNDLSHVTLLNQASDGVLPGEPQVRER